MAPCNRIARDIHDEIGSGLSKIALLSGGMERKYSANEELHKSSSRIQQLSRELIRSMGEIIWAVNPGNDSVSSLFAYLRAYLNQFSEETNIETQIELKANHKEMLQYQLNPELKRNILMVTKESLNNIQKHSGATKVIFGLEVQSVAIRLLIQDNGKGIQGKPEFNQGNGLKNMQKRTSELKGKISIDEQQGLRILLEIPLIV